MCTVDDFELSVFEACGDLEIACAAGDLVRKALASGRLQPDELDTLTVQHERVVITLPAQQNSE